jgi:hypothetical protein
MVTKIGNLFILAEKKLKQEVKDNAIPFYTALDVIEYGIEIRKWLDKPKNRKIANKALRLTVKEINTRYYQKRSRK